MKQTHTELHTHLMGMLSIDGIIELLKKYEYIGFPIDDNGNLNFENPTRRTRKITDSIISSLYIKSGEKVPYDKMDSIYVLRSKLLQDLSNHIVNNTSYPEPIKQVAKKEVYSTYLILALRELIEKNVKYVEISYSNPSMIEYMLYGVNDYVKSKIKFRFLLSTDRCNLPVNPGKANPKSKLEKDINQVRKCISKHNAIGFDFMGKEKAFDATDLLGIDEPLSFRHKLKLILEILKDYPKSTLRVHAGENLDSKKNPLLTLKMIDEVANHLGITIPPPEIRLGHAIYFEDTPEYIELLKKFKCIVEINASSNKSLSNIKNYRDIDYKYYIDNNIPIVLSTDGGGIYSTHILKEDYIANILLGDEDYEKILKTDKNLNKSKGGK